MFMVNYYCILFTTKKVPVSTNYSVSDNTVYFYFLKFSVRYKMSELSLVTCTAPVNIAVIKYWGKRDENLILPINDSIRFLNLDNFSFINISK